LFTFLSLFGIMTMSAAAENFSPTPQYYVH
jgi:hypothetical protein